MPQNVKPSHPRSSFCFYVTGQALSDDVLLSMQSLLTVLESRRKWTLGPPALADEMDGRVRMIGGTFDLYTAIPPFGADLPKEIDREHFEEITAIVDALSQFSKETGLEINCTLDRTYVGRINGGVPDHLLSVGLLGEWKKVLEQQ